MKVWTVVLVLATCIAPSCAHGEAVCSGAVPKGDERWQQIDRQYSRIEHAMVANDAKQLFAVYAPDFERCV